MKKFAKMSLVAAVAVAGLTSYASAGSLEDAIKDSKISGYVRYRMNTDHENDMDTRGEVKFVAAITTKVNDNVSATVKTVTDNYADGDTSDSTPLEFSWNQAYFTYANGPLTVKAGRLGLVSPLTDNANSGMGTVATYGLGPVTLAAAYYLDTDKVENKIAGYLGTNPKTDKNAISYKGVSAYGIGAIGSVEMVNFQGWYMSTLDEISDDSVTAASVNFGSYSAYVLQADAKFGPIGVNALYAEGDIDEVSGEDISYLQLGINGSMGIVSAQLNYVKTGEQSGDTTFDNDSDAAANLGLLTADMMYVRDADAWHIGVEAAVTPSVTLGAHHLVVDGGNNAAIYADNTLTAFDDIKETELNASYKMSKNFKVTGRYSFGDVDSDDFQNSRIELLYTF